MEILEYLQILIADERNCLVGLMFSEPPSEIVVQQAFEVYDKFFEEEDILAAMAVKSFGDGFTEIERYLQMS